MDLTYKVQYTEPAIYDLDKLLMYLTGYNSYNIIDCFQNEIESKLNSIKHQPYICQVVFEQHGYIYRKLIIKKTTFSYIL